MIFDEGLIQIGIRYAIRIGLAIVVVLIGRYLSHKLRDAIGKFMDRPEIDEAVGPSMERILKQLAYFGVIFLTVIMALIVLGVPVEAVVSVSGIALRESLSNLAATLTIIFFGTYYLGEDIDVKGKVGTVREIQPFNTVLLMGDKGLLTMPNGEILNSGLINLSRLGVRRADVEFLVEYGQDMARIERIVLDTLAHDPRVQSDPAPYVSVTQLGASGVTMQARPIVRYVDYDRFMLDMRGMLKNALEENGIALAVPHQSILLNTGQNGVGRGEIRLEDQEKSS